MSTLTSGYLVYRNVSAISAFHMPAMLQGILRSHATEAHAYASKAHIKQPQSRENRQPGQVADTTLRVRMKVVKKPQTSKANGELPSDKARRHVDITEPEIASGGKDLDHRPKTSLLHVPSDERIRRRLSESLEFGKPAPRVRRRSVSFDPFTVFKTAILENDVDVAREVLVSGKVHANSNLDGVLPIIVASKEGCAECLELLIENGASIDACDKRGFSPLELAVHGGYFDCAQVLIAAGANANSIRDGYFDESIENGRKSGGRSRSRTF